MTLLLGFVVDMFQVDFLSILAVFVADTYLTFGVLIMLLVIIKEETNGSGVEQAGRFR